MGESTPEERVVNALTMITGFTWEVKKTPEHADDPDIGKPVLNDPAALRADDAAYKRFENLEAQDAIRRKHIAHPRGYTTQIVIETFDVPKLERIAQSQAREGRTFADGAKRGDIPIGRNRGTTQQ